MKNIKDIFLKLETFGFFSRIDEEVWPTAFKCATVSTAELHLLRKVKNVVRKGRIESLENDKIIFKNKRFENLTIVQIISSNLFSEYIFILGNVAITYKRRLCWNHIFKSFNIFIIENPN